MKKTRVVVLGASGMLGSMVADVLARQDGMDIVTTVRDARWGDDVRRRLPNVESQVLDVENAKAEDLQGLLGSAEWVINAIGVIKPYIHDDNAVEVQRAIRVNALFPHLLAAAAEKSGCRVLQIATDCVYSGAKGRYAEADAHDALDVYGKSKSLGEAYSPRMHHLRCSIIGPEPKGHVSLLDWFLRQKHGASVNGYTNHQWNGVTTYQFARICHGVIVQGLELPHAQHVVPTGAIAKSELLRCFASEYGRSDVSITPTEARTVIDRTLATGNAALNSQIWRAAGYATVPSVPEMVAELARFDYRFRQA